MSIPPGPDVSVVLLARNEQGNIGPLISGIRRQLKGLDLSTEIIVVDGDSTDRTRAEAEESGARCILQKRLGYGGALREGFLEARGMYVLTLDVDQSHSPEFIPSFWAERERADIVVGSRFVPGGASDAPFARRTLSQVLNFIFSHVIGVPVRDSSGSYRLYRREVLRPNDYREENFNILQEILVTAIADGWSVREVPHHYRARGEGKSNVAFVKFCTSYLPTLYRLWVLRHTPDSADYESNAFVSRHLIQRFWQRRRFDAVNAALPDGGLVLDAGCGSSRFIQTRPDAIALDLSEKKLRFLTGKNSLRVRANAESLPFGDESIRRAVACELLPYLESPEAFLREAYRVLEPQGTLVLVFPDDGRLSWSMLGFLYNRLLPNIRRRPPVSRLSRFTAGEMLARCGFRVEVCDYLLGTELVIRAVKTARMDG